MTNAVSHTASTVKAPAPKPIHTAPTNDTHNNNVQLLSLPEKALYLIIGYMAFPAQSASNPDPQQGQHDTEQLPHINNQRPRCRHSFIRPAFNLAQTCTTLYTLYRNRMLSPDFFGKDNLLSPDCDPAYCFVPMFKRLRSLRITGDDPFSDTFRCEFIVSERLYACDLSHDDFTHHMQPVGARRRLVRNESRLHESQVASFFKAAHNFREVRRLQLSECLPAFREDIWKFIADAWSTVLSELIVEDVFMMFEQSVLEYVMRMRALSSVQLMSQVVTYVTPFLNLSLLRYLDLSGCTVYDEDLQPLMLSLKLLERLDVSDTYVSPEITQALPSTLIAFAAGERHIHSQPPIVDDTQNDTYQNCFCFAYADEENGHVETCETQNPGDDNPRWNTKNYAFLRPDKLPLLTELKWGHWGCFAQGIGSLSGVIPSLRSLTLSGRDYDDEVAQFLLSATRLLHLELLGCDVTDDTAFVISRMTNLEEVDVSNCTRITSVGLFAMADGRAAREGKLQGIKTNASGKPMVPSVMRNSLLSHEVTCEEILNKFKLR